MNNEKLCLPSQIKTNNIELFGEFKSAPTEAADFLQMNKKIDELLIQIQMLRNEVRELKNQSPNQNLNQNHNYMPESPRPNPISYSTHMPYPSYFNTSFYPNYPPLPIPNINQLNPNRNFGQ